MKILILGRGYLAKKLSKDLQGKIYNLFDENENYDLIIYANFPSTSTGSKFFDFFYLRKKYYEIIELIKENLKTNQIFLSSYRLFFNIKNNFFDDLYIKYNKKILKEFDNQISNYFLPFIYDEDLINKKHSLFWRWNNGLRLYNENQYLPILSYKDFIEIINTKIKNYKTENFIFPSNLKTIKEIHEIFLKYKIKKDKNEQKRS